MDKHAYCAECGHYVALAGESCPAGHASASLRDVRSGPLPPVAQQRRPAAPSRHPDPAASSRAVGVKPRQSDVERSQAVGRVLGWLVVLVPALALGVLMVAMTEPQYEGAGLGTAGAWVAAFFTVALTLGAALVWGWIKLAKKRR
jgi:hypothetical protein